MFATLRRRLPALGRFPRLCLIGACLLLAAQSAAGHRARAASPAAGGTVPVLVATRTLPAGHRLARGDLRAVRWPAAQRPPGARGDPPGLVGRRLAGPVRAGEPITGTRLVGPDLAAGLPADMVAAAVPLADAHAVDLVRPGDRVDLLSAARGDGVAAPPPRTAIDTVARSARVLAAFRADDSGGGAEVVLALPRAAAARIARDSPTDLFTLVLGSP